MVAAQNTFAVEGGAKGCSRLYCSVAESRERIQNAEAELSIEDEPVIGKQH